MTDLPEPFVSVEVDCTDLDGFMLNVERLMASELVALSSHEVVAAALFLWCRAWKQRPAASLPDDDRVNAAFSRLPIARFRKLKPEILRGFVLCSDGRLYHRVLADEARRAFEKKSAFRRKRETDAERLRSWRKSNAETVGETRVTTPVETYPETRFVAEGQGRDRDGTITTLYGAREVHAKILDLIPGTQNLPTLTAEWPLVEEWMKAGADPERDILPTVQRLLATTPRPRSLKFFTGAITDARHDRIRTAEELAHAPDRPMPAGRSPRRDTGAEALAILERSRHVGTEGAGAA